MKLHTYFNFLMIFCFLFFIFSSCDDFWDSMSDTEDDCDYSDCDTEEPLTAPLQIKLTINSENTDVEIIVYKGNIEDKDTVIVDTVNETSFETELRLDEYYSATAKYSVGDKTVIAVDGDIIEKISTDLCDSTCWEVKGGDLDLRLKYTDL